MKFSVDGRPIRSKVTSKGRGTATQTARISPALVIFLCLAGCGSLQNIGYQSPAAIAADDLLVRDVAALVSAKTAVPVQAFNPLLYSYIATDITSCKAKYNAIPYSAGSLRQLADLSDQISIFKKYDSTGAHSAFFTINGIELVIVAQQIDSLEHCKLIK